MKIKLDHETLVILMMAAEKLAAFAESTYERADKRGDSEAAEIAARAIATLTDVLADAKLAVAQAGIEAHEGVVLFDVT